MKNKSETEGTHDKESPKIDFSQSTITGETDLSKYSSNVLLP